LIMSDSNDFNAVIIQNRRILLAILMLPVIGMAIAIPLIMWKIPERIMVAGGVILFLMVQYLLLVWWIAKKMNKITQS